MQPSPEPVAPDQFGPYEVYERLGLGGMATVCRAKKRGEAGFERSVALKRMLSHLSEDKSFVESFIREAKVSSLLVHPNIAQVYDFGRINGTYYIAMELVPGFDLRKLLRYANRANESIPLGVVLSILGEMCDALDYAHLCLDEQGKPLRIVHRDISPSNIIVAATGHTKVIDFGIAKANSQTLHTASGQVKGKLGYMSPEAALGMQIEPVSDVFSMGVVAWELVTASPLFSARTDFETMRKIREAPVAPPSTHNPACPPELDRLILSALERDSSRRLASAGQFRRGLDQIAVRSGLQMGARIVGEWIRQFIQPEDYMRHSGFAGRESPTSVLRPSPTPKTVLKRSSDDIQLAAEIWGEDAGPNSIAAGPDFSISGPGAGPGPSTFGANPNALPPSPVTPLPMTANYTPSGQHGTPPGAYGAGSQSLRPSQSQIVEHHIPGYMPASMQQIMPYAVPGGRPRRNRKLIYLVLALAAVAAALVVVLLTKHETPPAPARVTFAVTPASAVVEVDGTVAKGEVSLGAGDHEITAHDPKFKPLAKSITVAAGDKQVVTLALDPAVAHVALDSTPRGAFIELDGKPAGTTPAKLETTAGTHHVEIQNGNDRWSKDFDAAADASVDFTATFPTVVATHPPTPVTPHAKTHDKGHHRAADTEPEHSTAPVVVEPVTPPPVVTQPVQPPVKPPVQQDVPEPPKPARTPVVAATAVTKVSGDLPVLRGDHDGDVLVKMCIDEAGKVTSVKVVKTSPDMPSDLVSALQSWSYKPYIGKEAKPESVCFALSLRVVVKHD
ncbi:MAG: protein kinase [Deltaproteobacteria bacterium]